MSPCFRHTANTGTTAANHWPRFHSHRITGSQTAPNKRWPTDPNEANLCYTHSLISFPLPNCVCDSFSLQSLSFLFFSSSESYVTENKLENKQCLCLSLSLSQSVSHLTVCERLGLGVAQKQVYCIYSLWNSESICSHCFFVLFCF